MGIEFKIDKTNPLEVFPDFPKTWDEMTDKQIEFWLKQLARFGGSEEDGFSLNIVNLHINYFLL